MHELQSKNDIVLTDTDKGEAVVTFDMEHYVKEAERQLNSKEKYKIMNCDPHIVNKVI